MNVNLKKNHDVTMRLNQFLAHAGICSRREADKLIEVGTVEVNGEIITKMGYRVKESDKVKFNGQLLKSSKKIYVLLNKPKRYSCRLDNYGKKDSIYELTKSACKEKILPVNKLAKNESGLIILTNDEQLKIKLSSPKKKFKKIYHLILNKNLNTDDFNKIKTGIIIEDEKISINSISFVTKMKKTEIGIDLNSNKKNIIEKIFSKLGYKILKLDLVYFGGLTKKNIPRKKYRLLNEEEINLLKRL
tara:strand:+ start:17696 stop:18433 length:738 start_codon:yes stop_codon:yes gene_type:complete